MTILLGVDIGTQGAKAVLCDADGSVLASAYREQSFERPAPGFVEQDADRAWWGAFVDLVHQLLGQAQLPAEQVAGVGICAFVPAMLALDEKDRPLRPAILYTDRRAVAQADRMVAQMEAAGYERASFGTPTAGSPLPQLKWVQEHEPEVYRKTARVFQCHTYLVYRLTGQSVIDQAMKRSYTPLYDSQTDGWSRSRGELIGVDTRLLPERMAWAGSLAGRITPQAAQDSGLAPGTPVAVGTADAFADMVGAGAVEPGTAVALYGSFSTVLICQAQPVADWDGHHCLPDRYVSGAAVPTGAVLMRWFRDQFGHPEIRAARSGGENAYQLLSQLAGQVDPGCDGLIALPDFSEDRSPLHPAMRRGALVGLSLEHTRAHVYRALLEGIAYELRWQLSQVGGLPAVLSAAGGGAANQAWTQIMSDVLGVEQNVLASPFSAAIGSAYLAGMAMGRFSDTGPLLSRWVRIQRTVRPQPAVREIYDQAFKGYGLIRETLWPGD